MSTGIRSQYEVARLLGISRGRVNELERSAFRKLRAGLRDWAPDVSAKRSAPHTKAFAAVVAGPRKGGAR